VNCSGKLSDKLFEKLKIRDSGVESVIESKVNLGLKLEFSMKYGEMRSVCEAHFDI